MCIRMYCSVVCTQCGRSAELCDDVEDALETAELAGFIRKRVENGSMWDFCPQCITKAAQPRRECEEGQG